MDVGIVRLKSGFYGAKETIITSTTLVLNVLLDCAQSRKTIALFGCTLELTLATDLPPISAEAIPLNIQEEFGPPHESYPYKVYKSFHGTLTINGEPGAGPEGRKVEINLEAIGTDPADFDTDGDWIPDGVEYAGMPLLDPLDAKKPEGGTAGDADHDGVCNYYEYLAGTDWNNADTDGDGLSDSVELGMAAHSFAYFNPPDADGDGIIDALESRIADSDGDRIADQSDSKFERGAAVIQPTPVSQASPFAHANLNTQGYIDWFEQGDPNFNSLVSSSKFFAFPKDNPSQRVYLSILAGDSPSEQASFSFANGKLAIQDPERPRLRHCFCLRRKAKRRAGLPYGRRRRAGSEG